MGVPDDQVTYDPNSLFAGMVATFPGQSPAQFRGVALNLAEADAKRVLTEAGHLLDLTLSLYPRPERVRPEASNPDTKDA